MQSPTNTHFPTHISETSLDRNVHCTRVSGHNWRLVALRPSHSDMTSIMSCCTRLPPSTHILWRSSDTLSLPVLVREQSLLTFARILLWRFFASSPSPSESEPTVATFGAVAFACLVSGPPAFACLVCGPPAFACLVWGPPGFACLVWGPPGFAWLVCGSPAFACLVWGLSGVAGLVCGAPALACWIWSPPGFARLVWLWAWAAGISSGPFVPGFSARGT